jgi:hypothetical protein
MSERHIRSLVHGWETVRLELLNTKVSDLGLRVDGSPVEPYTRRLLRELESRRIRFRPEFYLSDVWGCPNKVPVIGIRSTCPTRASSAWKRSRREKSRTGGRS